MLDENERMRDALEQIERWVYAYPEAVFPPVSPDQMERAARVLREVGISMDAMHAEWARHIMSGIHEIVRSALYPEAARKTDA